MRTRPYFWVSLGVVSSSAFSQTPTPTSPIAPPTIQASNPLGTQGFSSPPSKSGAIPKPGEFSKDFKLISNDSLNQDGRKLWADGHVVFEYDGYHVTCDHLVGDKRTRVFLLEGSATLQGSDSTVHGERLVVDFPNKAYEGFDSNADLRPNLVGGQLKGDLYVKGEESHGTQNDFFTTDGSFTTCNLINPHFDLDSNDVEVRYGIRAILRRAQLRLFGKKLFTIPYIVIPLDDRSYRNLPAFGYTTDEGYYVKTRYGIPLKGDRDVLTHVDYMSYLGLGLGGDYHYRQPDQSGTASIYGIFGTWNELIATSEHHETFKFGTLSLNEDYERNNYLADPGETTFNLRGSLALPQGARGNTLINFTDSITNASFYSSSSENLGITDDRRLTPSLHTNLGLNYSGSNSSSGTGTDSSRQDLSVKLQADEDIKKATLGLEYLRDIPIGDNANFNSGADITPEISLSTDAQKIMGRKLAQTLPFKTEISWGDFANGVNGGAPVGRTNFDFSFQKPDLSKRRFTVNLNGEFKQGFYSDGTAEYVLNFGSDFRYSLGKDTAADLRYSYLRPYGYSPLSIDQTGQTNLISLDTTAKPIRDVLTGIQTGYDITQLQTSNEPWQPVGIRTEYSLKNYFALRGLSTYDPTLGEWTSVRLDLTYKPGATSLAIGSRYDGTRHTWTSVSLSLINLKMGRTKFSADLAYNGYTERFDTQQYNVIYDLHCAEAVFTLTNQNFGFRPGNQIEFFIRLKALPFDGNFGFGTRGQPITTNTGRDF
jgi:LPS-assembly protein